MNESEKTLKEKYADYFVGIQKISERYHAAVEAARKEYEQAAIELVKSLLEEKEA